MMDHKNQYTPHFKHLNWLPTHHVFLYKKLTNSGFVAQYLLTIYKVIFNNFGFKIKLPKHSRVY